MEGYSFVRNSLFRRPSDYADLTRHVVDIVADTGRVDLLLDVRRSSADSLDWIKVCVRLLAQRPDTAEPFPPSIVDTEWEELQDLLGYEGFDLLIARTMSDARLEEYMKGEFDQGDAGLHSSVVRAGGAKHQPYRQWCSKGLRMVDSDTWRDELAEEGDLLELVIDLRLAGYGVGLADAFSDPFIEHARTVLGGQNIPTRLAEYWHHLPAALRYRDDRKTLRRQLLGAAVELDGKIPPPSSICITKTSWTRRSSVTHLG